MEKTKLSGMKKCVDKHEKTNYYGYNRIKINAMKELCFI